MQPEIFVPADDTHWKSDRLRTTMSNFRHLDVDIRDRDAVERLFRAERFELVIHCAAQPSHDKAREIPITDFEVNAVGTLYLLEATRTYCPGTIFIQMSTNKVYG